MWSFEWLHFFFFKFWRMAICVALLDVLPALLLRNLVPLSTVALLHLIVLLGDVQKLSFHFKVFLLPSGQFFLVKQVFFVLQVTLQRLELISFTFLQILTTRFLAKNSDLMPPFRLIFLHLFTSFIIVRLLVSFLFRPLFVFLFQSFGEFIPF